MNKSMMMVCLKVSVGNLNTLLDLPPVYFYSQYLVGLAQLSIIIMNSSSSPYKNHKYTAYRQTNLQMLNTLRNNAYQQELQQYEITITLCKKQSSSGWSSNQRLLILFGNKYIGYARNIDPKSIIPFQTVSELPELKDKVLIQNISSHQYAGNTLIIHHSSMLRNSDKSSHPDDSVRWKFQMSTPELARAWDEKIELAIQDKGKEESRPPTNRLRRASDKVLAIQRNISQITIAPSPLSSNIHTNRLDNNLSGFTLANNILDPNLISHVSKSTEKSEPFEISSPEFEDRDNKLIARTNSESFLNGTPKDQQKQMRAIQSSSSESPQLPRTTTPPDLDKVFMETKWKNAPAKSILKTQKRPQSPVPQQNMNLGLQTPPRKKAVADQKSIRKQTDRLEESREKLKQLQQINYHWNLEMLLGNQKIIIPIFDTFCKRLVTEIVNDLQRPNRFRMFHPKLQTEGRMVFEVVDLSIQVTKAYRKQEQINSQSVKQALKSFQNLRHFHRISQKFEQETSHIRTNLKSCLSCMVEYKGFFCLVKTKVPAIKTTHQKLIQKHLTDLLQLQKIYGIDNAKALINNSVVLNLDIQQYQRLLIENQQDSKRLQTSHSHLYLHQLNNLLPQDALPEQDNPNSAHAILRHQLVNYINKHTQDQETFILFETQNNNRLQSSPARPDQRIHHEQQIKRKQIDRFKIKHLLEAIEKMVSRLQECDEIIIDTNDLSRVFHRHGVNMRCLGQVYETAVQSRVKHILMCEAVARSAKIKLSAWINIQVIQRRQLVKASTKLASHSQEAKNKKDFQNSLVEDQSLIQLGLQMINGCLNDSSQSDVLWGKLNKYSQKAFNLSLEKSTIFAKADNDRFINMTYLVKSLVKQLGIDLDQPTLGRLINGESRRVNRENFIGFRAESKHYDIDYLPELKTLRRLVREESVENFKAMQTILLDLNDAEISQNEQQLPSILNFQPQLKEQVRVYLSLFISPKSKTSRILPSAIYQFQSPEQESPFFKESASRKNPAATSKLLTLTEFKIRLSEINWALKQGQENESVSLKNNLLRRLQYWIPNSHLPMQVHDIFVNYNMYLKNYEQALTEAKKSLICCIKSLGHTHILCAEAYFKLGEIFFHLGNNHEALNHYTRAVTLLQSHPNTSYDVSRCKVYLELARSYRNCGDLQNAVEYCRKGLAFSQGKYEIILADYYDILLSCYRKILLGSNMASETLYELQGIVRKCLELSRSFATDEDQTNLMRFVQVLFEHFALLNLGQVQRSQYLFILESLLKRQDQKISRSKLRVLLRSRAMDSSFFQNMKEYLTHFSRMAQYINKHKILETQSVRYTAKNINNPVEDFLIISQALLNSLGIQSIRRILS